MSVLPTKGRKSALQGLERVSADVVSEDLILPTRFTSSQQKQKPFLGVTICGTGFSRDARRQVQVTTERLGGQYSRDLHLNCTHLVVHNCSGRKFEHAVKHGEHRGLHVVSKAWFEDCVKQNARLDESLYPVPVSAGHHQTGAMLDHLKQQSAPYDGMEAGVRLQRIKPPVSPLKVSGMYRSPLSPAIDQNASSLAGARFYIDPNLGRGSQHKAQESAESCGATCVRHWSQATHVVCEPKSISKYIGLNLHLVSPTWVTSARDGCPLRCVHYSADLARDVGSLLLRERIESLHVHHNMTKARGMSRSGAAAPAKIQLPTLQQREKTAALAKAGVHRRRGPQIQSWRTRPRPQTPASLLESTHWIITDAPTTAQVYSNTQKGLKITKEQVHSGKGTCRYDYSLEDDAFHDNNIYSKPLSQWERRQSIVFPGSFLTILFPIDRFSELGPSSRTFFSDVGFTPWQIIQLVYAFYQAPLDVSEVDAAIHTDSKHGDRLRACVRDQGSGGTGMMARHEMLGARVQFQGLQRTHGVDPCSHIYDLLLGTTSNAAPVRAI